MTSPSVPSPVPAGTEQEALERVIGEAIADGPLDIECPTCQARRHEPCMEVSGLGRRQRRDGPHVMRVARTVAAAVVSSSPATPEGGQAVQVCLVCGHETENPLPVCRPCSVAASTYAAPSPASPAETREGLATLAGEAAERFDWYCRLTDENDQPRDEASYRMGIEDALDAVNDRANELIRAASPAVSLPGEGLNVLADAVVKNLESLAEPWSYADGVARDATIRAAMRAGDFIREWKPPSLPGEQPGGDEQCTSKSMGYRCSQYAGHEGGHRAWVENGWESWSEGLTDPPALPVGRADEEGEKP